MSISRRHFLAAAGATGAGLLLNRSANAQAAAPPVCVFAKHLQFITDYAELAKTAKSIGLDGLDVAVRKGGHVEPVNVAVDLPRCVDAVRAEGLDVFMVTTALSRAEDADARPILEAASKLGIRFARVGGQQYSKDGNILEELDGFTKDMRGLAALLESFKMVGGYHNHSGGQNVGAPMWDLFQLIRGVGNDALGSNFDVGHATVEGGLGAWRLN
ncbi:MAG: TIM barrel protein, partial [Candidatus Hydrogenedentes bacterium]|nr:TIM barrel protein [Candidatus Hydrogenedentota bacterium]